MKWIAHAVLLLSFPPRSLEAAIVLHQVENFSGAHDWTSGQSNPNPPVVIQNAGPAGSGDRALLVTATGDSQPGGRLLVFNTTSWTGNYTAAGITTIVTSLQNLGADTLSFRLAFSGPGGWFVTPAATVGTSTGWVNQAFDVRPTSLVSAGGANAFSTLAAVQEIRILHSPTATFRGAQISSSFLVDEIRAVPEPSTFLLLGLAGLGCFSRRRCGN